jgi:hypothetical protein
MSFRAFLPRFSRFPFSRFPQFLARLTVLAGACFSLTVHAGGQAEPAAATGRLVTAADPAPPDPQRWVPLMGATGMISYFDQTAVRRRGPEVGVVLMRNAPTGGVIRTASGDTIRSSLKRMVLNCATSMFAVVEQTLYSKRYARGDSLYTIRAPQTGMPQPISTGTLAGELMNRLCR